MPISLPKQSCSFEFVLASNSQVQCEQMSLQDVQPSSSWSKSQVTLEGPADPGPAALPAVLRLFPHCSVCAAAQGVTLSYFDVRNPCFSSRPANAILPCPPFQAGGPIWTFRAEGIFPERRPHIIGFCLASVRATHPRLEDEGCLVPDRRGGSWLHPKGLPWSLSSLSIFFLIRKITGYLGQGCNLIR